MWPVRVALKYCLSKNGRYGKNKNGNRCCGDEIQSSRIGFCGEYNKEILSKMGAEFKKIFAGQIEAEYKAKSVKTDKIIYRVSTKSTECEMILNGK